jgi:hypothetical protein
MGTALYPQFLTKYDVQAVDAGMTFLQLRFLVGASGAITSFSHQGSKHIRQTLRLKAGYYGVKLDGVWYVERAANLAVTATPFTPAGNPTVIGPLTTSGGTIGQVVNDQTTAATARNIAHGADSVVAATKTFTIANGAFTAADVGGTFNVFGSANGNDGTYTIATVTSATVIVVVETVTADETFGSGVTFSVSGAYFVIAFNQSGTPGAADVDSGSEVSFIFSLKSEAP